MEGNITPNPARGEVSILLNGQPQLLRFNLRTLHNHTTATGTQLLDLGNTIIEDMLGTVGGMVAAAVRVATGKAFTTDEALDLLSDLPEADNTAVTVAVVQAVRVDRSPLFKALIAQLPQQSAPSQQEQETSGASTSNSPPAS